MTTEDNKSSRRSSMENVGRRIDSEMEEIITYINDEVVPAVRDHSSRALRNAARKLADFADYLDQEKP